MLGRQRRRCASSRQFEIAIGLTSRQTKFARQRHGRLRHASSVRQQPPCRSQSVGLLLSRGTNHLTQPYYRLRRKSTAFLPRKPTIVRSKWKLSFAFREPPVRQALLLSFQVSLPGSPGAGITKFFHNSLPVAASSARMKSRTPLSPPEAPRTILSLTASGAAVNCSPFWPSEMLVSHTTLPVPLSVAMSRAG